MTKKLIFTCILLLTVAGLKAQTYCYYWYESAEDKGSGWQYSYSDYNDSYSFLKFTFKGDFLFDPIWYGEGSDRAWKLHSVENDGYLIYREYYKNIFGKWKLVDYSGLFIQYYKVSGDRKKIVYCKVTESFTELNYFERCPDWNCR